MRADITWYDLIGALPDASSEDIRRAYDAKAGLLRPELLSGAPSTVVTAAAVLRGLGALNLWLARHADYQRRIPLPDARGLFYDVFQQVVGRLDLQVTFVQLTEHPMPVEGLVVEQSPGPSAKMHPRSELTIQVWHPPARATEP